MCKFANVRIEVQVTGCRLQVSGCKNQNDVMISANNPTIKPSCYYSPLTPDPGNTYNL